MNPDYSGAAAGFGTAVKNGVKLAMQETGQQFAPQGYRPPMPPQSYPGAPPQR